MNGWEKFLCQEVLYLWRDIVSVVVYIRQCLRYSVVQGDTTQSISLSLDSVRMVMSWFDSPKGVDLGTGSVRRRSAQNLGKLQNFDQFFKYLQKELSGIRTK
jgi:hypothetical protein